MRTELEAMDRRLAASLMLIIAGPAAAGSTREIPSRSRSPETPSERMPVLASTSSQLALSESAIDHATSSTLAVSATETASPVKISPSAPGEEIITGTRSTDGTTVTSST